MCFDRRKMGSGHSLQSMENDGGIGVGEGWAVEQCERVCCKMYSRRSD